MAIDTSSDANYFKNATVTKVGVAVLEAFSPKLYDHPIEVIREYISNSVDAGAKNVKLFFNENENSFTIIDDGHGIRNKEHLENALAIMLNADDKEEEQKRIYPKIGEFGIGFYAGGKVSEEIEIKSTVMNDENFIHAEIPIGKWLNSSS